MRKLLSHLLCLCLAVVQLQAQTPTSQVSGTVTDEKGLPLAAVTVTALTADRKVVTTTVTDANGKFSLNVNAKVRNLQFSYIGLEEQFVPVGNRNSFPVTLRANSRNLSEVVVVGYGTQSKRDVTASVAVVKGAAIASTPVQSFEQGLAGRAAGVQITITSGVVNEPPVFRVRGTNSISLSSQPLIVVDGVPSFTGDQGSTSAPANPLASINPNDIESIDIAKDPAATAIYGSRGSNGVVFVTTKKGRSGRLRVAYDGYVGQTSVYGLPKLLNAEQYIAYKSQAVANSPSLAGTVTFAYAKDKNGNNVDTKWSDVIYHNGFQQSHNISVSGGNDNTTFYLSTGYTDQSGIIRKNSFNRKNILANVDSRVTRWLTVGGKLSYSDENNLAAAASGSLPGEAFSIIGLGRIGYVLPSILPVYNADGSYNIAGSVIGSANITGTTISYYNPKPILDLSRSNNENNHVQANIYAQLKPFSWLTLKTLYGSDNLWIDNDLFSTPITGDGYTATGSATSNLRKLQTWVWTNTAQFDYVLKDDHTFSLLAGNEQTRGMTRGYGLNRTGLADPSFNTIQTGYTNVLTSNLAMGQNYLLSNFGRLTYNYKHKYFLSGTARRDEYSAFGIKGHTFGGASLGWEIAQENFWKSAKLDHVFSSFKFRGSWGTVGNSNGVGDFASYSFYNGSNLYGGLAALTFSQGSVGNPAFTWETSKQTDIGINLGILNDRITGQFAYYNNDVSGLILNVPQAPSTGIPTVSVSGPPMNVGTMYNRGIEATINATVVQNKAFTWVTSFNITENTNKVTALAPGLPSITTATSGSETVNQTKAGYAVGYLWVIRTAGVDATSGRRIFLNQQGQKVYYSFSPAAGTNTWSTTPDGLTKYVSSTGGTNINQGADAVMYANPIPKLVGGWSNTFTYGHLTLDVLLTYQAGFKVYYGSNAGLHDQRFWNNATDVLTDAWDPKNPKANAKYALPIFNDNVSNGSAMPMDINVFSGNFIKVRNAMLSYSVPSSWLDRVKISSLRLYVAGQNLAIITKYPGPDPEVASNGTSNSSQGVDRNTVANGRTITIGLNVGF